MILAGWSAYPRQLDFKRFREIADSVGALLVTDMAHFAGLVAAAAPEPDSLLRCGHHHDAQDVGRRPRRMILCKEGAKKINYAVFPGHRADRSCT